MACGCGVCPACVSGQPGAPDAGPLTSLARCGTGRQRILQRLAPRVDAIRLRTTELLGSRPYDVFLVWERWTGKERGEGDEKEIRKIQILPKPKVADLTSLSLSPFAAGILPVGSVRLTKVTTALTQDNLSGKTVPGKAFFDACGGVAYDGPVGGVPVQVAGGDAGGIGSAPAVRDRIPEPYEFFYELVEANALGGPPPRAKFRLLSVPFKNPSDFSWVIVLERISEDRGRDGKPRIGTDPED